jgi:hypothetical protein
MDMGFAITFPGAELPPESISAYVSDWSSMIKSNGPDRFLTGLRHACQITSFFPTAVSGPEWELVSYCPSERAWRRYNRLGVWRLK